MQKSFLLLGLAIIFLSGCATKGQTGNQLTQTSVGEKTATGACKEEKVPLTNYGDSGKRLKNCFVEYPGEPTRQDKSYYIVEDICGQFTKEFIQNLLGKTITEAKLPQVDSIYNCTYYLDEKNYLMLNLEYLKIANQKIFYESSGAKVEASPQIPMENVVIWEKPDLISVIYLVLDPEKFISIRPANVDTISSADFLNFASKLGEEIKDYK